MVLFKEQFHCCPYNKHLFQLSLYLFFPFITCVNLFARLFRPTTKERRQRAEDDPCYQVRWDAQSMDVALKFQRIIVSNMTMSTVLLQLWSMWHFENKTFEVLLWRRHYLFWPSSPTPSQTVLLHFRIFLPILVGGSVCLPPFRIFGLRPVDAASILPAPIRPESTP